MSHDPRTHRFPECLAADGLDGDDPGFAAFAPLDHTLHGFQAVDVVAVRSADTHTHRFFDFGAVGDLDGRHACRYRQGRAGHQSETHLASRLDHLLRPVPVPRQMLIVEHWDASAALFENVDNLLEELVPRIQRLALLVFRILPVFGDEQHAVYSKVAASQGERFRDRRIDLHRGKLACPRTTQIVLWLLVDVQRH